jgi:hypothetical protein
MVAALRLPDDRAGYADVGGSEVIVFIVGGSLQVG